MVTGWLKGTVKAVPTGDSLLIMSSDKGGPLPEKTATLVGVIAPKLVLALVSVFVDQGCGVAGCTWRDRRVHIGCNLHVE
jgi:hypothetical protein